MAKATERNSPFRGSSPTLFALFNESTRRGYTYEKIGKIAGVGRSTVSSWWRGDRSPGIGNLEAWARGLGGFLVFSLPAEIAQPRDGGHPAGGRPDKGSFRPQMDEWSRESRPKIPYAGREDVV